MTEPSGEPQGSSDLLEESLDAWFKREVLTPFENSVNYAATH